VCVELQGIQKQYDVLPASFLLLTFYFFQKIDRFLYKKSFVRSIPILNAELLITAKF
jgi:hypothetical protein